jgi:hypothetical protein
VTNTAALIESRTQEARLDSSLRLVKEDEFRSNIAAFGLILKPTSSLLHQLGLISLSSPSHQRNMAAADAAFLRAVANHIVLPPDLPGGVEKNLPEINGDLLRRAQDACTEMRAAINSEFQQELSLLESSLDYCYFIHTSAHLDSLQLQRAFRRLQEGEILIVHVHEQNAGLLVRHGTR